MSTPMHNWVHCENNIVESGAVIRNASNVALSKVNFFSPGCWGFDY